MSQNKTQTEAIEFARTHKKEIAKELIARYPADAQPVSVFMAGSPGAGKTEFSKELLDSLDVPSRNRIVRIDGDELRDRLPGYAGSNSNLFHAAVSILVEKIHDMALERKRAFILDGTFSKYDKAKKNIDRSLKQGRDVTIFYLYQTPRVAWKFTQAREKVEGRNIPKSAFIDEFLGAHDTVGQIHEKFKDRVVIFVVKKDFTTNGVREIVELTESNRSIDEIVGETYTKRKLEEML